MLSGLSSTIMIVATTCSVEKAIEERYNLPTGRAATVPGARTPEKAR
jgi:hypothetical protein